MKNHTTHPQGRDLHNLNKFTWRFLALSRTDITAKPCRITLKASTEAEARRELAVLSPYFEFCLAVRLPVQGVRHV